MNPLKRLACILIHFVLLVIIMFYIFHDENKVLDAPLLAISIFLELSLFSYVNKIIK